MADRSNRESATREKQERKVDWKPPSTLDAPEAPVGYKHRWIRASVMDYDDKSNVFKRRREGYELVRAEEYPDFETPTIDEGKNAGVIGQGGLLLARIPEEVAESRDEFFRKKLQIKWQFMIKSWQANQNLLLEGSLKPEENHKFDLVERKIVISNFKET